jgi:hypothetical protein
MTPTFSTPKTSTFCLSIFQVIRFCNRRADHHYHFHWYRQFARKSSHSEMHSSRYARPADLTQPERSDEALTTVRAECRKALVQGRASCQQPEGAVIERGTDLVLNDPQPPVQRRARASYSACHACQAMQRNPAGVHSGLARIAWSGDCCTAEEYSNRATQLLTSAGNRTRFYLVRSDSTQGCQLLRIRRLGVRIPPAAPSSKARSDHGMGLCLWPWEPRWEPPGHDPNRARLIDVAAARLSPSSRCRRRPW